MSNFPLDLLKAIENNNCAFFIGAGMSVTSGLPLGEQLLEQISKELENRGLVIPPCDNITQLAILCKGGIETFKDIIADALLVIPREIPVEYRLLAFLCKKKNIEIYTMNYDLVLEHVFNLYGVKYSKFDSDDDITNDACTKLIKLAGDVRNLNKMKVTSSDLNTIHKSSAFKHLLANIKTKAKVVFIGYSLNDITITSNFDDEEYNENFYMVGNNYDTQYFTPTLVCNTAQEFFSYLIYKLKLDIKVGHIKYDDKHFGGIETYLSHLVQLSSFVKDPNHQFTTEYFNIYSLLENINSESIQLGFPFIKGAASILTHKVIGEKKIDIIHAHDFISAYHAQMLGVPVVFTSHSLASKDNQHMSGLFNADNEIQNMEQAYYPLIPNIITLSDYHKSTLPPYSNLHAKKLPLPFYATVFAGNQQTQLQARCGLEIDKLSFSPDDFVIMYIGRNDLRKGFQFVLSCFDKLKERIPQAKLLLVTPGVEKGKSNVVITFTNTSSGGTMDNGYKSYNFATKYSSDILSISVEWESNAFKSDDNICDSFTNHFSKIAKLYRAADLIVIPSLYEPLGYVALEALACGCPILANETGGLKEVLRDEFNPQKKYATFCQLGNNPNSQAAGNILANVITDITIWDGSKYSVKKEIRELALEGQRYIVRKFDEAQNRTSIEQLRKIYFEAIINSADIPIPQNDFKEEEIFVYNDICNEAFWFYMLDTDECVEIIKRAGYFYKDILYIQAKLKGKSGVYKEPQKYTEDYGLFWGIAGLILKKKAHVPAISLMGVRSLAEAITEITRSRANNIKSIFEVRMNWEEFKMKSLTCLKELYNDSNFQFLNLEKSIKYETNELRNSELRVNSEKIYDDLLFCVQNILNNMVKVNRQTFMMGAAENHKHCLDIELPMHKVKLSEYYICRFPVTQKEWKYIMDYNHSCHQGDEYPVENVCYSECMSFIRKINDLVRLKNWEFSLPTEAQWECAAKCGMENYTDYSGSDNLLEIAWFRGNTDTTHVVGERKCNSWGISDMCGNVQEFCLDIFDANFYKSSSETSVNPCCSNGENCDRVTRGGAFNKLDQCCRVTNRYDRYSPDYKDASLGFRLVLNYRGL